MDRITCPACSRRAWVIGGRVDRHAPLMKIPGRRTCPLSGEPVPNDAK